MISLLSTNISMSRQLALLYGLGDTWKYLLINTIFDIYPKGKSTVLVDSFTARLA